MPASSGLLRAGLRSGRPGPRPQHPVPRLSSARSSGSASSSQPSLVRLASEPSSELKDDVGGVPGDVSGDPAEEAWLAWLASRAGKAGSVSAGMDTQDTGLDEPRRPCRTVMAATRDARRDPRGSADAALLTTAAATAAPRGYRHHHHRHTAPAPTETSARCRAARQRGDGRLPRRMVGEGRVGPTLAPPPPPGLGGGCPGSGRAGPGPEPSGGRTDR